MDDIILPGERDSMSPFRYSLHGSNSLKSKNVVECVFIGVYFMIAVGFALYEQEDCLMTCNIMVNHSGTLYSGAELTSMPPLLT